MYVLGIDPGATGGIAIISAAGIEHLLDMPVKKTNGKTKIDGSALASILSPIAHKITHAVVEQVSSRPGQGVSSTFTFGASYGRILGVLEAIGIAYDDVRPQAWQSHHGMQAKPVGAVSKAHSLKLRKEMHARRALDLYPSAELYTPRGALKDGRADALLIAHYSLLLRAQQ